jgi:endonuclease YncB( thermonuclease family)
MAQRRLVPKKIRPWIAGGIIVLILLGQFFGWFDNPQPEQSPNAREKSGTHEVVRFVDGDTVVVRLDGKDETIRMTGVDTPETNAPGTPVQCYGPAASAYTKNLIGNQQVRLERDTASDNRDRYGRLLRYVYLPDGRLVAEELIKNGYGFAYTVFPFAKKDVFVAAEENAKSANKGLWGNCTVNQENGRKQTNPAGQ